MPINRELEHGSGPSVGRQRKRTHSGPRTGVLEFQSFWQEVFEAIGKADAKSLRDELRRQLGVD